MLSRKPPSRRRWLSITVGLVAVIFVVGIPISLYLATILSQHQVGPHSFTVAALEHGEVMQLPDDENVIVTCPSSADPNFIFQGTNGLPSDLYLYEYTSGYDDEKQDNWSGESVRPGQPPTLGFLKPGRTYFAKAGNATTLRCSAPAEFGGLDPGNVFFVDGTNGDDAYDGMSELTPFRTLGAAQLAVRTRIVSGMDDDVMVLIRGGTYEDAHLDFTSADSGRDGHKVVWRNYPGETPKLVGGSTVQTPWTNIGGGIYRTNIGTGRDINIALEDGDFLLSARYPNENAGWLHPDGIIGSGINAGITSFHYAAGDLPQGLIDCFGSAPPPTCGDRSDTKLLVWPNTWSTNLVRIASIDNTTRTLTYAQPLTRGVYNTKSVYHVIGHRVLLDAPGEYFYDRTSGDFFLYPRSSVPGEVLIPTQQSILAFRGTRNERVEHIHIEGLEMLGTDFVDEFTGNIPQGFDVPMHRQFPSTDLAAIVLENARHITIYDNDIHHAGTMGVAFAGLTNDNVILGNTIANSGVAGVMFNGDFMLKGQTSLLDIQLADIYTQNDLFREQSNITRRNAVVDNDILDSDRLLGGYSAIIVMQSGENMIAHNRIRGAGYAAVNILGMDRFALHPVSPTPIHAEYDWFGMNHAEKNVIAYNDISQVMKLGNDGGAFYSHNSGVGNVIYQNDIHDIDVRDNDFEIMEDANLNAIYFDQNASYFQVVKNLLRDIDIDPTSFDACRGSDVWNSGCGVPIQAHGMFNLFDNNFIEQSNGIWAWSVSNGIGAYANEFIKNIILKRQPLSFDPVHPHIPAFRVDRTSIGSSQLNNSWNVVMDGQTVQTDLTMTAHDRNVVYYQGSSNYGIYRNDTSPFMIPFNSWLSQGAAYGYEQNSVFNVDPLFANPDAGDYSLPPNSPALALGIQQIDTASIGRFSPDAAGIVPVSILPLYTNQSSFSVSYVMADDPAVTVRSQTFNLSPGANTITISDQNNAGQTVSRSHTITLDTTPPAVQVLSPLPSPNVSISPTYHVYVRYQVDGGKPFWRLLTYTSNQTYTSHFAFYDRAGNRTVPTGVTFCRKTVCP